MRVEPKFNSQQYEEVMEIYWEICQKKNSPVITRNIIVGIVLLIVSFGFYPMTNSMNIAAIVILVVSGYFLISTVVYYNSLSKAKKNFFEVVNMDIKKYEESDAPLVFEFSDSWIFIKQLYFESKFDFEALVHFEEFKNVLFLYFRNANGPSIMIHKEMLGEEFYNELLFKVENILKKRLAFLERNNENIESSELLDSDKELKK
jgi:hypothetical protein